MAIYEIPLTPGTAQSFGVQIAGANYRMRLTYADAPEGGWLLDIANADGNLIVCGIPLVTGVNLLDGYEYLGIGAGLAVATDGDPDAVPTFDNLGADSHLYLGIV